MTGYGQASCEADGVAYLVEIKTVNNRYIKTILRVSDTAAFMNDEVEKVIRSHIHRGTVNYSLRMHGVGGQTLFDINENVISEAAGKLMALADEKKIDGRIDLAQLLSLPGVVCPVSPDAQQSEQIKKVIFELTNQALEKLKQMRAREGKDIADDILGHCELIARKLEEIGGQCGKMVEEYRDKLKKRTDELLAGSQLNIDESTLAREVAVYAERSDIAEEVARLQSHLRQFAQCCKDSDNSGRRLDFISQEMLREANTIASKASDTQIIHLVLYLFLVVIKKGEGMDIVWEPLFVCFIIAVRDKILSYSMADFRWESLFQN